MFHRAAISFSALTILVAAAATAGTVPSPKLEAMSVMVILDSSGSMNRATLGGTLIAWANRAAITLMKSLGPGDRMGVLATDTASYLVVPLQPPHPALELTVGGIRAAGGGIFVYSALERARVELEKIKSGRRHVLLLADGTDAEEMCKGHVYPPEGKCPDGTPTAESVAHDLSAKGITVTVVALGHRDSDDVRSLENVARAGGGKFYITRNPRDIHKIFVDATTFARTSAR